MMLSDYGKIGFGTFGSDKYDEDTVAQAVYQAIITGYRIFDCAAVYGNEKQIGGVFKRAFEEGIVKREDIFVISKVWNDKHGEIIESCAKSIDELGLDYVDLYFTHWPFPNYHAKGCNVNSRNSESKPFFTEDFISAWRQMERLKTDGLSREIGMSNMTVAKFNAVLPYCEIKPYAHEIELHPSFQQRELYHYCKLNGMEVIGFCPLGSPNRPERDKTPDDVSDTELHEVKTLAEKYHCHPAEICLKWAAANGHIPIPFASKPVNIENNFKTVQTPLNAEETAFLGKADKNCRLVKGQVFLWKGASDWKDLWDENGVLTNWKEQGDAWIKEI